MRIDELSRQERDGQSTVNQLIGQVQELRDKLNSLNDATEFYDPETASSSGLSHVPSQPVIGPTLGRMLSRRSCLQPDTRNAYGTLRNVFEDLLAPNEPTSAYFLKSKKSHRYTVRTGRLGNTYTKIFRKMYG